MSSYELTIARDVLRTRRRIVTQPAGWTLSAEWLRSLRGQARQRVAETQQAKRRLEGYLAFWKDDGPPVDKTLSESTDQVPAINTQMSHYETADVTQPSWQTLCPVPIDRAFDGTSTLVGEGYRDPRETQ